MCLLVIFGDCFLFWVCFCAIKRTEWVARRGESVLIGNEADYDRRSLGAAMLEHSSMAILGSSWDLGFGWILGRSKVVLGYGFACAFGFVWEWGLVWHWKVVAIAGFEHCRWKT